MREKMRRHAWAGLLALASLAAALLHRRLGGPVHLSAGMVLATLPAFAAILLAAPGRTTEARVVHGAGLILLGAVLSGALFIATGSRLAGVFVSLGGIIALLTTWPAMLGALLACALRLAPCP